MDSSRVGTLGTATFLEIYGTSISDEKTMDSSRVAEQKAPGITRGGVVRGITLKE